MYEQRNVAYRIAEIAKILLVARGPICNALPKDAVDAAYLMPKKKITKLTKPEWSHTGSPKRWLSLLQKDGELMIKKKRRERSGRAGGSEAGVLQKTHKENGNFNTRR